MKKLILLAAVVMIAGCAFGQKKDLYTDPIHPESKPFKTQETVAFSNDPAITSMMKVIAIKKDGGHWELQGNYTLDDLMDVMTKNQEESSDRCRADKQLILDVWDKSLHPVKKKPLTPKKANPIKKAHVTHDKIRCGLTDANCTVTN